MQTKNWLVTRGNHEDYVVEYLKPESNRFEDFNPLSYWTFQQLPRQEVRIIAQLPLTLSLNDPAGGELRAVHASMLGTKYGIWHHSPDEEVREQIFPPPKLFCTGHIHYPFIRVVDDTLIVNSGSVGSMCDQGDIRATYARLEWLASEWHVKIVRVPYDTAQTYSDFLSSKFLEDAGAVAKIIYEEWRLGWPITSYWKRDERWKILEQEVGTVAAVEKFLSEFKLDESTKSEIVNFYQTYPF